MISVRKPHRDFAGYLAELRNKYSGGHTVISDCKLAEKQGTALVENYAEEGGRYQVLCNEHGHLVYCTNLPVARECMKDPTTFCMVCRCIAGEGPENWETQLAPHDVAAVWLRRGAHLSKDTPPRRRANGRPGECCPTCAGEGAIRHAGVSQACPDCGGNGVRKL